MWHFQFRMCFCFCYHDVKFLFYLGLLGVVYFSALFALGCGVLVKCACFVIVFWVFPNVAFPI
uniref:Putative ovule protein n=1 Tax=Solanum chacoense TaxID=4108 RepID=A0A0V0GWR7_SOLCH